MHHFYSVCEPCIQLPLEEESLRFHIAADSQLWQLIYLIKLSEYSNRELPSIFKQICCMFKKVFSNLSSHFYQYRGFGYYFRKWR